MTLDMYLSAPSIHSFYRGISPFIDAPSSHRYVTATFHFLLF
jgi:hypothetical protein